MGRMVARRLRRRTTMRQGVELETQEEQGMLRKRA